MSAYKRNYGPVKRDRRGRSGQRRNARLTERREVVDEVFNEHTGSPRWMPNWRRPRFADGRRHPRNTPNDFGRIAAQTAKQVILQRIARPGATRSENFAHRVGEVIGPGAQRGHAFGCGVAPARRQALNVS